MTPSVSPPSAGVGQVCDRCRMKKIKCDASGPPKCENCVSANTPCVISATLRRKTKIRGFKANSEEEILRLRHENEQLKNSLRAEREANDELRRQLQSVSHPSSTHTQSSERPDPTELSMQRSSDVTQRYDASSNLVIKHMGRLVLDDEGHGRFAGSSTGVHFILSVQQSLLERKLIQHRFPESCYRLYLLSPFCTMSSKSTTLYGCEDGERGNEVHTRLREFLNNPLDYYTHHVNLFHETWSSLCPVLTKTDLIHHLVAAQITLKDKGTLSTQVMAYCFQMVVVVLINSAATTTLRQQAEQFTLAEDLALAMLPSVTSSINYPSLQGLVMFSLYALLTRRLLLMPSLNGLLVRAAHFCGLHRHTRRFKLCAGQIELRNRIWWYIYIFDKVTSLILGLPQLIHDVDADVDYPIDCDLDEIETIQLSFPLPGETTAMMPFLALVRLSRILADILDQLYTTTSRRGGPKKITNLHSHLIAWRHRFGVDTVKTGGAGSRSSGTREILAILDQLAMTLIHLPGLTFEETTPEFHFSLSECTAAATEILNTLCSPAQGVIVQTNPFGPSIVMQCGLMHVFYQLHPPDSTQSERLFSPRESGAMIEKAAGLLLECTMMPPPPCAKYEAISQVFFAAISETTQLLNSLGKLFTVGDSSTAELSSETADILHLPSDLPTDGSWLQSWPASFEMRADFGSLENLNNLDYMDWIVDKSSEIPFSFWDSSAIN